MENIEIIEYDHLTGQTVERILTEEEQVNYEETIAISLQYQAEQEAKAAARASALAKLAELGLTEEEVAAL